MDNSALAQNVELAFLPMMAGLRFATAWTEAAGEVFGSHSTIAADPEPVFAPRSDFNLGNDIDVRREPLSPFANLHSLTPLSGASKEAFVIVSPNSGSRAPITRDLVKALLTEHPVHIVEWADPRWLPASVRFDLDDYTDAVVEAVRRIPGCNLVGISQSGIPATVAASLMEKNGASFRPSNLIIMGSPVDAHRDTHQVNWMMRQSVNMARFGATAQHLFECVPDAYPGAGRLVLPPHVQKGLFTPTSDIKPSFAGEQALPAEQIRQTINRVFGKTRLMDGDYEYRKQPIDPHAIRCGVMTVIGEKDEICSPAQTEAVHDITTNARVHACHRERYASHYGLIYGPHVPAIAQAMKAFAKGGQKTPVA